MKNVYNSLKQDEVLEKLVKRLENEKGESVLKEPIEMKNHGHIFLNISNKWKERSRCLKNVMNLLFHCFEHAFSVYLSDESRISENALVYLYEANSRLISTSSLSLNHEEMVKFQIWNEYLDSNESLTYALPLNGRH